MPTPVVMPQMGESIAEGTVVRWIKRVGDHVERDEPLFEISTDKVDAEIPSPAAGIVLSIDAQVGETVPVGSVVATIGAPGEAAPTPTSSEDVRTARAGGSPAPATLPGPVAPAATGAVAREPGTAPSEGQTAQAQAGGQTSGTSAPAAGGAAQGKGARGAAPERRSRNGHGSQLVDVRQRLRSSPLVRRMAKEHGIDVRAVAGTGVGGRVTKQDLQKLLEPVPGQADAPERAPAPAAAAAGTSATAPARPRGIVGRVDVEPLSPIRKKIAEHMVLSRRTSAHVHSVFHVDFSAVDAARRAHAEAFAAAGTKLTYMAAITRAAVVALGRHRIVNASLDGDNVLYRKDVNVGIAVALETGLIVPVIKHADLLSLIDLCRAIQDLASRARSKQLKPDDVQGGTFTITNPGQLGAQFGLPIINQPQVAILGVGSVEKRPVVVGDAVVIRPMAYLTLGFDHRLIDGAVADQFMADVKREIEAFSADAR